MKFTIIGKPRGKGRPRFTRQGFAYTDKETRAYEKLVKISYDLCEDKKVYEGNIKIEIWANFVPIKSTSKKKYRELIGQPYNKKPDIDNIAKIILDGLNEVAYKDDNQVVELVVHKTYAEQDYVEVEIKELMNG